MSCLCHAHDGLISEIQTEALSATSIRRTLLRFERAVNKNQDQRSKYPDKPEK
jgi:beta-catenin-like protein 1